MALDGFVDALFERGQVHVSAVDPSTPEETARAGRLLLEFERMYRHDLSGDPPELLLPTALWGATMMQGGCRFLVYRDLGEAGLERELSVACPEVGSPAAHYSVDLTFRFLPDLLKMARLASGQDPLVKRLIGWAAAWPLSSVGVPDVGPVKIDGFADDPCLLALYADRIIARRDRARLDDARAREAVRQALGLFDELAPELAGALKTFESQGTTP